MITRPTPTERQFNFGYFADAARAQGQEASVIVRNGTAIFTLTDHGQTIELTTAEAAQFVLRHEENTERDAEYSAYLESLPFNKVANAPTMAEFFSANAPQKPKTPRPPLGSLGDCLAETAAYLPRGFTKITGCTKSFWRDIPADKPDTPWFVAEATTACLEPAPVTIYISAGTPAATAREILKQVAKWLKVHGDELPGLTPIEPQPAVGPADDVPF